MLNLNIDELITIRVLDIENHLLHTNEEYKELNDEMYNLLEELETEYKDACNKILNTYLEIENNRSLLVLEYVYAQGIRDVINLQKIFGFQR